MMQNCKDKVKSLKDNTAKNDNLRGGEGLPLAGRAEGSQGEQTDPQFLCEIYNVEMNHLQAKRHTCGAEGGFLGRQEGNIGVLGRVESKERRKGLAKDQQKQPSNLRKAGR